jgi:hypothetical protein
MRPSREVGAAATLCWGEHARRVHLSFEGVPEDLPRLGRRLPGIVQGVEPERSDPTLEAEVGRISPPSLHHYRRPVSSVSSARRRRYEPNRGSAKSYVPRVGR